MGLSVTELSFGYSRTGAQQYLNDLNTKAIVDTKTQLSKIDGIRTAIEENWQGQAALNFITNLQNAVTQVQNSLDLCKQAFDTEMANIEAVMVEQDNQMVAVEE